MQNLDVLNALRRLGLNKYEAKAFLTLTTNGTMTAGQLSDHAGLPRPRVYDILVELKRKGFVKFNTKEKLVKYEAIDAKQALDTYKKVKGEELKEEWKEVDALGAQLDKLLKNGKTVSKLDSSDSIWTLKGRDSIYTKLASMIEAAKSDIVLATTSSGIERKMKEHGTLLEKARGRGVKVSIMSPTSLKMSGVQNKNVPTRMCLADDQALLFMTHENEVLPQEETALWFQSKNVSDTLKKATQ